MGMIEKLGHAVVSQLDPETAHRLTVKGLKTGLSRPPYSADPQSLATRLPVSGMMLPNPVGLAAGFDKNAEVFEEMLAFGFGFVECGTVTPRPQPGNPRPRLFRLKEDGAVINRMGFNNDGLGPYVRRLAAKQKLTGVVGANIGANKVSQGAARIDDYVKGIEAVWPYSSYLTVNISSPNTPGLRGLQERSALEDLLDAVGEKADELAKTKGTKPIFLKVAPDVDDDAIVDIADVALSAEGLTGLIVSNTTIARPDSLTSAHRSEAGGLSGRPLFEPSTRVLAAIARLLKGRMDLIGAGGISDADTAYAKIRAGAHAVQLYSALVYKGAGLVQEIKAGLAERLAADGFNSVSEAVGADL